MTATRLLEACLAGRWLHLHEEDSRGAQVYRREGYSFPPARGRDGFEFGPDGELTYLGIAPADGTQEAHGRWRVESPDRVRIEFQDGRSEPSTFEVVSCDEDTLTIKR